MKKRLLALALCLVMMTSLLPLTAAAYNLDSVTIQASGVEWGSDGYNLKITNWILDDNGNILNKDTFQGSIQGGWLYTDESRFDRLTIPPEGGGVYYTSFYLKDVNNEFHPNANFTVTLEIQGYETECSIFDAGGGYLALSFRLTKLHEHQWQYTTTENSLTATCQNSGCNIGTVGVTLTADSVTLPNSPFKANLTFEGDFKEVFHCSEIEYKYEDPATGWNYVDPDTFTPKPGNYQAGVLISGLPGNGGAAARAVGNEDGAGQNGSVYLFVKYTAVDPKVTAQTGDNRPIELMLVSAAVFSALAAAAFILDNRRKYSR